MERDYFISWYRLDGIDRYCVWFSGATDGYVVDSDGYIPCFPTNQDASEFAASLGLSIVPEESSLQDLDRAEKWVKNRRLRAVDCETLLAAWNLLDDVSRSTGATFDSDRPLTNKIYEKLFFGNNLPPVTPEGCVYEPIWSKGERDIMRTVLGTGLSMFRSVVKCR